ncbi:MAG: nitroreductase family protein, partial [Candidatus Subteraquimicrobiales bacterium]|nr:nitroreductase family protein [Candidatus Subteraquimicrobiales bacterium]
MKTVARFFKLAFMLISICACLLQLGCTQIPKEKKQEKIENTIIELPGAKVDGKASLEEVLNKRKSVRDFTEKDLTLEQISQLLWAAQGKSLDAISGATRTAPSAGALHPLEIY